MKRRSFLQSLLPSMMLAAPALGGLVACMPPPEPLRVGANLWPGYAPLRMAEMDGLLDARVGRVLDFPSTSSVLSALRNGSLEAAALTLDETLLLAAHGHEPRIVMVFNVSDGADVLLCRPDCRNLADLGGRKIGVETEALGAYMLSRALQFVGLGLQDVEIVPVPLDGHEAAFLEGRVDAVVTFEPVRTRLLAVGARELLSSRSLPGEIVDVLVVPRRVLETRLQDVRALVTACFAGRDRVLADARFAAARLGARLGLAPEDFVAALQLMRLPSRDEMARMLAGGPDSLAAVLGRMQQTLLALQLLPGPVDTAPLLSPVALPVSA